MTRPQRELLPRSVAWPFFLLLTLLSGCGKIEQVQESFVGMISDNDLSMVEVRVGSLYRHNPSSEPNGYDYLNFGNVQYRLGALSPEVQQVLAAFPVGQIVPVYFKGQFSRRSGLTSNNANPNLTYDIVDIQALTRR